MKPDDFEKQIGSVPFRPVPGSWRKDILDAAHEAARPEQRRSVSHSWWRELLWPCPQAWAGLLVAWAAIVTTQMVGDRPHAPSVSHSAKAKAAQPGDVITVGLSAHAWAKLIDGEEPTPADVPKSALPPRRSNIEISQIIV